MAADRIDQRLARGARTREEILKAAADLGSAHGLQSLTLGQLGEQLQMSRSGIVKHFGSREQLQLATLDYAAKVFFRVVVEPVQARPPGMSRLNETIDNWLDYLVSDVFPGGCFFTATASELDSQPGPLRDTVKAIVEVGLAMLRTDLDQAVHDGDLAPDADIDQLLFELHAYLLEVNLANLLLEDPSARERGHTAIKRLLAHAR